MPRLSSSCEARLRSMPPPPFCDDEEEESAAYAAATSARSLADSPGRASPSSLQSWRKRSMRALEWSGPWPSKPGEVRVKEDEEWN